ncbi:MAG: HAD family hydrolase [Ferrovibrio sp.]|uniref:HAD family hydrolase n=1 Tax=Ferrovibrio sp. TaxID=1917215 RepID=UPI00262BE695|nr:HAD family hydrolase [Ferrovibrio sp.]MCW0233902.1 HAD family hydrolase [Ferrovibrio sp.]
MNIRGLLFDKDGTLVDVDRTWGPAAWEVMTDLADGDRARLEALIACSHYIEEERRFRMSSPLLAGAPDDYADDWAAALGRPPDDGFRRELSQRLGEAGLRHLTPLGALPELFAGLQDSGLPIGLATNHGAAGARRQLRALGIEAHFGFVAGSDSGFGRKPGPGMVQAFAAAAGLPVGEIALIGDSFHDLHAARAAGAIAIAVPSGLIPRAALAAEADLVIGSLAELPSLLAAAGGPGRSLAER